MCPHPLMFLCCVCVVGAWEEFKGGRTDLEKSSRSLFIVWSWTSEPLVVVGTVGPTDSDIHIHTYRPVLMYVKGVKVLLHLLTSKSVVGSGSVILWSPHLNSYCISAPCACFSSSFILRTAGRLHLKCLRISALCTIKTVSREMGQQMWQRAEQETCSLTEPTEPTAELTCSWIVQCLSFPVLFLVLMPI